MDKPYFEQMEERLLLSGLLGINLEFPQGPYDATGTVAYTAGTQSFDSEATPLAFRFSATEARPILAPRDFQLHIQVDNAGNLIGGVAGDDLVIEGQIDRYGDGSIDFDGVLLTGEIAAFGSLDSGGTVDQYDFRFTPTGGDLVTAGFFTGMDIGVRMTSALSTFTDDWTIDFNGRAQGVFGAIESLALPDGTISGFVWEDFNDDAMIDFDEMAIEGATVTLTGTNDLGDAVNLTDVTDADGLYAFTGLRAGTYTITETQPAGYQDGQESLGEVEGTPTGVLANDVFTEVVLETDQDGMNYNFGERPDAGGTVAPGQTATIGFWQNKNGRNLIKSLNGGENATQLSSWLAATFPNMYGVNAGANDLTGMTNADIASFYKAKFKAKVKGKNKTVNGPTKMDCQVMATAFAVYVTNSNLAGTTAASFGFLVTDDGVGTATWNVGDNGAAFGVANYTEMMVIDLLLATDDQAVDGVLYDLDAVLRTMANDVYSDINESGDI
ncbi:MAG: SdrD B-like domain-containing protein [Planctomycetota bacterium]|jgi:hypothetical protein